MANETSLNITGILLGGLLSLVFIGYIFLSFSEGTSHQGEAGAPRKFAGLFSLVLGVIMAGSWVYFVTSGWESFRAQASVLSFHVLMELGTAVMIIVAGIAMIRNWSRGPALFMVANGLFLFTTVFALMEYGVRGHPFLMNGISILLMLVSVYMVGLVYAWEHFVLRLDESES